MFAEDLNTARSYAADALAPRSKRAYEGDWNAFAAWCTTNRVEALPAAPETVAAYLAQLAERGRRLTTIRRALAGIAWKHRNSGNDWRCPPLVWNVLRGIERTIGNVGTQKSAILAHDLARMLAVQPDTLRGVRNRAILALGWAGALRRSEIVGLDLNDLQFDGRGLSLVVRKSKTDAAGLGLGKTIPYARDRRCCAVLATLQWLERASLNDGAVFCRVVGDVVTDQRLLGQEVTRIVKVAARAAGLDPAAVSGVSLRAGFVTAAVGAGCPMHTIMRHTGHRSEQSARRYIRPSVLDRNPLDGLL